MCITRFGAGALAALPGEGSLLLPLSEHEVNPDIEQQGHHEGEVEGHQRGVDDETRVGYGTDTGIPWGGKERERERGAAELLWFSTRTLWCVGKARQKVAGDTGSLRSANYALAYPPT